MRTVLFSAACVVAIGLVLAIESVSDVAWHVEFIAIYGAVLLLGVFGAAAVLRPGARPVGIGVVSVAAALVLVWLLPINPCERFARDVQQITRGMTPAEVDDTLSEHVKGTQLRGADGRRIVDWHGATYYEPRRQHHSFDTFALVAWRGGVVVDVRLHLD